MHDGTIQAQVTSFHLEGLVERLGLEGMASSVWSNDADPSQISPAICEAAAHLLIRGGFRQREVITRATQGASFGVFLRAMGLDPDSVRGDGEVFGPAISTDESSYGNLIPHGLAVWAKQQRDNV